MLANWDISYARVRSPVERHNPYSDDHLVLRGGWTLEYERMYGAAGLRPEDIDVLATYTTVIVFVQIEKLGFCPQRQDCTLVRDHELRFCADFPARLPVNVVCVRTASGISLFSLANRDLPAGTAVAVRWRDGLFHI